MIGELTGNDKGVQGKLNPDCRVYACVQCKATNGNARWSGGPFPSSLLVKKARFAASAPTEPALPSNRDNAAAIRPAASQTNG